MILLKWYQVAAPKIIDMPYMGTAELWVACIMR